MCASLVALYFLRRVSCPRGYFEGVAFHGFPFGIQKVQRNANLVDLDRSRKMQKNDYSIAKFGVDTAENEPLQVWGVIQFNIYFTP